MPDAWSLMPRPCGVQVAHNVRRYRQGTADKAPFLSLRGPVRPVAIRISVS